MMFGRLQFWLQGWPDKERGRLSIALGNGLSFLRYWSWRIVHPSESPR